MKKRIVLMLVIFLSISLYSHAEEYDILVCPWPTEEDKFLIELFAQKDGVNLKTRYYSVIPDWVNAIKSDRSFFSTPWLGNGIDIPNKVLLALYSHRVTDSAVLLGKKNISLEWLMINPEQVIGVGYDSPVNRRLIYQMYTDEKLKGKFSFEDVVKRIRQLPLDVLIKNYKRGRISLMVAAKAAVGDVLKNKENKVFAGTKDFPEYVTKGLFIPKRKLETIDKGHLIKILKAMILAAEYFQDPKNKNTISEMVRSHKELPKEVKNLYETEEILSEYRRTFHFYNRKMVVEINQRLPEIYNEMREFKQNMGEEVVPYEEGVELKYLWEAIKELEAIK